MKVSSLIGVVAGSRTEKLQILTQTMAGGATSAHRGGGFPVTRPEVMAPPPLASSFGGADPRAMIEVLMQMIDRDEDEKLSPGEVDALTEGGLLARSLAVIDGSGDGALNGDAVLPPDGLAMTRRANFASVPNRSAAATVAIDPAGLASGALPGVGHDPATMIEAMVMSRVAPASPEDVTLRSNAAQQAYKLR
ncbi:MAG: hypothetical protein WCS20_06335 [Alphaproteobacteria bacterium]